MLNNINFKILRMTEEHIREVAKIESACFSEPWSEKSLSLLVSNSGVAFVALVGETIAAYAGMITVLDEGQITNVAVFPEFRRLGYGRAVVNALLEYAKDHEICSISLEVRESNSAAILLYESLGWKKCGTRKNFYRFPSESAIIMVRNL